MHKLKTLALAGLITAIGGFASAESWTLNGDASRVAFGSVKSDSNGEVHHFSGLSGSVSAEGAVSITIDLASVETNIDIRNERMIEYVFKNAPEAEITAEIDMAEVADLAVGESTVLEADAALTLVGSDVELYADMYILRLSEDKVMVSTNDMIMLSMEDVGLMAGIDKLRELADLPGITRVSPVTLRLVFDLSEQKA